MRLVRFLARGMGLLAASTAYLAYVFQWRTRPFASAGISDWLDPYFINAILEHWYWSLTHFADPTSPTMYYPAKGTLGYSVGLILYAPFYVIVRPFLHPFQAHVLTLALAIETGAICLYLILRRHMRLGFIEALAITMFFLTSGNLINIGTGDWSQRLSVFLMPPVALLVLTTFRARTTPRWLAAISGVLVILLFAQDFYPPAFAAMLAGLLLIGVLLLTREWRSLLADLAERLRPKWRDAVGSATSSADQPKPTRGWLIAAACLLTWAAVVTIFPIDRIQVGPLRVSARHPDRPLSIAGLLVGWWIFRTWRVTRVLEQLVRRPQWLAAIGSAIRDSNLARVVTAWLSAHSRVARAFCAGLATGVLIFIWIYARAYFEHPAFPRDQLITSLVPVQQGWWRGLEALRTQFYFVPTFRPFYLVLVVSCFVWLPPIAIDRRARLFAAWSAAVALLVLVIPLRVGQVSLWTLAFAHVPGLSVVRDPKRLIEVFELAVAVLAGLLLARPSATPALRRSIVTTVCVLMLWDWNRETFRFERQNALFDRWVDAPIAVDRRCRSFFMRGASAAYMGARPGHMWSLYGVDAWFISMKYGIPTINGYSAWAPTTWRLSNPQEAGDAASVDRWIDENHLTDVCVLDIDKRTMILYGKQ